MRYPRKQNKVVALVGQMIDGITEHGNMFTHCDAATLQALRDEFAQSSAALADVQSQAAIAAAVKLEKFNQLQAEMKRQIKLGVIDTSDNPVELSYIGWGPRREAEPIGIPAQPLDLKIIAQGQGMLYLSWQKNRSNGCGPERCFVIERRQLTENSWSNWQSTATALNNKYKLTGQPAGCKLEYRVKAINKSGSSFPSNTICLVL